MKYVFLQNSEIYQSNKKHILKFTIKYILFVATYYFTVYFSIHIMNVKKQQSNEVITLKALCYQRS